MKRSVLTALPALLLLAGCFGIEASLELEPDLSGTVGLEFTINMEPMAYIMASLEHAFSGGEGQPSAEEIAAARAELMSDMDPDEEIDRAEMRRRIVEDLPEDFHLRDADMVRDGLRTQVSILVDFPHIDRLDELKLHDPNEPVEGGMGQPGFSDFGSLSEPFEGIRLIDEGNTWRLEIDAPNPVEDIEQSEEMEMGFEGLDALLERAFADLRVAMKITVPGRIVEHNATRVEERTLYWEYTYETLHAGAGEVDDRIMVRFRK